MPTYRTSICRVLSVLAIFCAGLGWGQTPASVTIIPNSIIAGGSALGIVDLSAPAKAATVVALGVGAANVSIPKSVTVAAGQQSATFKVTSTISASSALALFSATAGGVTARGFAMVQATPIPGFASVTFSPNPCYAGDTVKATIAFSQPLFFNTTFELTSPNADFVVPASVTATMGAKAVTFPVTISKTAQPASVPITVELAPGEYVNCWSGPLSSKASLEYKMSANLPAHYQVGTWVSDPYGAYASNGSRGWRLMTLHAYSNGHISLVDIRFCVYSTGAIECYESVLSEITVDSQNSVCWLRGLEAFPVAIQTYANEIQRCLGACIVPAGWPEDSTLTFSADGKTALWTESIQYHHWDVATSSIVWDAKRILATLKFTKVR